MYLLDSDWIIQVMAGHQLAVATLDRLAGSRTHISLVTAGEIYEGAFGTANPQAELVGFRQLLSQYHILTLSDSIMERFAETRANLRRQGQLIPDMDLLIAATALERNLTLLTFNVRDFQRVPGLQFYRPR